ncbi:RISC-loading complex subunit TARBP2-like isoform X2 [Cataglyphis hispanica]|nr:RISC-loading complex subunit TARBP2-like isoform X2 [Cataglyphis hispanica]XP_050451957.1 RISC-loading complex subunit TARBP2-like isoform X2 [Cataglyphis hispanica]XP_050451958.1 RISC-loading complex subunit TARBP2-like isoform X2 [Cataglyphis hispanica]
MAKSPISILQELSIKEGYVPIYDFIGVKTDGIYNQFVCKVKCKEFSTEGVGYSKKDAKHNAAKNMLLLLPKKNEISILSPIANTIQISTPKICEPSSPRIQTLSSPNHVNYVGLLQEFCVQQKLMTKDILYEVVDESGPPHMRIFTIEVSVGSIREKGSAQCKKIAKQEAAKKLLQRLHPDIIDKFLKGNKNDTNCKVLEDIIQKLGVEISECIISKPELPVASLSKKAQMLYTKCTNKEFKVTRQDFLLKDLHDLFKKTYSNKISRNMKKKMQIVRDIYTNHADIIEEVMQDIVKALEVKIEKTILPSLTKNYIISLRLSSNPIITQFGMDETKDKAEIQAKYNVIVTVLTLLNIS